METTDLFAQVEDLEANIDELEDALHPLLSTPLHTTASSLPLLDRAKLHVLTAYAIESLLFSSLQASGIDAKEHAIFAELGRLKGYFKKIKDAELGPEPKTRIDKDAAARFIKHGLAGNEKYDAERKERMERERAGARAKAERMHIKFDEDESGEMKGEGEENDVESENEEMYGNAITTIQNNAEKEEEAQNELAERPKKRQRKEERKAERREKKQQRRLERAAALEEAEKDVEMVIPEKEAQRTHSATFKALLERTPKKRDKKAKWKDM